jgi:hypothetical protein
MPPMLQAVRLARADHAALPPKSTRAVITQGACPETGFLSAPVETNRAISKLST